MTVSPILNSSAHTVTVPVDDYERMKSGLARYEYVRTLTPQKFASLWELCMQEDIPFDKQIDAEIAYERIKARDEIRTGKYETRSSIA